MADAGTQAKMNEAKNMALLFFMDHLMQKNGRRTIHDLSCQFGARGFTQEMRDSVGATQEGLTDFLAQHPSLFVVDGDQVILKGFGELDGKNQLMKMPPGGRQRDYTAEAVDFFVAKLEKFGPELQIKSLLGHRSQAAPEVRLVSGRHLREFYEFLEAQTDFFIVEGDRVRLANMPEPKIVDEREILDDEGRPLAGMKAKQAAVDYLKSILEQNEDVPIPLDAFYKRFCERFPHSVRQDVATNPKELLQFLKLNRNIFFIRSNKVSLVRNREGEGGGSESGRSTASPDDAAAAAGSPAPNGAPTPPHGAAAGARNGESAAWEMFPLNRDNLHRVHLVKALKAAQEIVGTIVNDLNNNPTNNNNNNTSQKQHQQQSPPPPPPPGDEKFLCVDFKLVTLGGGGFHQNGGGGPNAGGEDFLSMVCVASGYRIAVFDLAHSDSILMESGLKDLLESASILKVIHDVKRVSTLLAQRYAVNMRNVFDTQIAHTIIQHEKFNKPLAELHSISFVNLQRVYFPQSLMLSDVTPRKLSQTPNWSHRPITDELLTTAAEECHCLMRALYRNVRAKLPEVHQRLFEAKCLQALTPAPTKPPPQIPAGLAAAKMGAPPALIVPSPMIGAMATPVLKGGEAGFNGIYRPPARRRLLEGGGLLTPGGASNGNFLSARKASVPAQQSTPSSGSGGFTAYMRSNSTIGHSNGHSSVSSSGGCCFQHCQCYLRHLQQQRAQQYQQVHQPPPSTTAADSTAKQQQEQPQKEPQVQQKVRPKPKMVESSTQTISTGKITALNIYYEEEN